MIGAAFLAAAARPVHAGVTMSDLWPSDDGRSWKYEIRQQIFAQPPIEATGQLRLLFEGPTVAPNGIAAQYLRQEQLPSQAPLFGSLAEVEARTLRDPLMRQVYVARPDLRARLLEVNAGLPCPDQAPNGMYALFLGGEFAYRKTGSEVAAWRCDLADTRAWQWLVSNLSTGTFMIQLVPDIATDVFLRGEVGPLEDVTVPAGTFNGCVRMNYVLDYGEVQCDDGYGNIVGTAHPVTQGFVDYAPFQGPVRSQEDYLPWTQVTGTCAPPEDVDRVFETKTLQLLSPSVPTLPTSWGAVKSIYR
jgi:hypothetical protein